MNLIVKEVLACVGQYFSIIASSVAITISIIGIIQARHIEREMNKHKDD